MKDHKGEHPLGDSLQIIFLLIYLVVWVGDSFILKITAFPAAYIPLYIRIIIPALIFILAIVLVQKSHFILEGEKRPEHVVAEGAFGYVRHPLYLASILFYFALAFSTGSLICLGLVAVIFLFYNYIASYEERILLEKFGENYKLYMKKTGKWIPVIFGKK